eukprot:1195021-Prorocentrum_minimum.AAC.2
MQSQMRLQMNNQESRFDNCRKIGGVVSVIFSVLMAVALAVFVLSDVVKVETTPIEDIENTGGGVVIAPAVAETGRDILASQSYLGAQCLIMTNSTVYVSFTTDTYPTCSLNGWAGLKTFTVACKAPCDVYLVWWGKFVRKGCVTDVLGCNFGESNQQEALDGVVDDEGNDAEGGGEDNNQVGGFDGVYQEVVKPLDPEALPEGAGLETPAETPDEPDDPDGPEKPEEPADLKKPEEETTVFVPAAQDLKARQKNQQAIMKANAQKLLTSKKPVSAKGLVAQEPAEFTAQTVKPPKEWPKVSSPNS